MHRSEEFMTNTVAQFIQSFKRIISDKDKDIQEYLEVNECTIDLNDYLIYRGIK